MKAKKIPLDHMTFSFNSAGGIISHQAICATDACAMVVHCMNERERLRFLRGISAQYGLSMPEGSDHQSELIAKIYKITAFYNECQSDVSALAAMQKKSANPDRLAEIEELQNLSSHVLSRVNRLIEQDKAGKKNH